MRVRSYYLSEAQYTCPLEKLVKTIIEPSGLTEGHISIRLEVLVMFLGLEPSALMMKRSLEV